LFVQLVLCARFGLLAANAMCMVGNAVIAAMPRKLVHPRVAESANEAA
jgi:hypothetical protein